jgi:hypothetical protein
LGQPVVQQVSETTRILVDRIFRITSSTSWVFQRQCDSELIRLLDQIAEQGEPGAIPPVAGCLFCASADVKSVAARTIQRLLTQTPPEALLDLGDLLGCSYGWYVSRAWEQLKPAEVRSLIGEEPSRTSVLGLLSFHRNGYVRHEAVRLLPQVRDGSELPYLLIRQNDWVQPIATEARRAVQERLDDSYMPAFAANLPLVVHLLAFRRHDHSDLVCQIINMLVLPKFDDLLAKAIRSPDRGVRRNVVRLALDAHRNEQVRVVTHVLSSFDGVVRLMGARRLASCFSGKARAEILESLERDRFMPVRREALTIRAGLGPDGGKGVWREALLDRSASIRELARFHVRNSGETDLAAVYRHALEKDPQSLAALDGLCETGDRSDLPTIRAYFHSSLPSRRRATVRGLAKLSDESDLIELVPRLQDDSPAVVREVEKQLRTSPALLDGEQLVGIVMTDRSLHVRLAALRLIYTVGKWGGLPWLVVTATHRDRATAEFAQGLIETWFTPPRCNRIFTKPSPGDSEAIQQAFDLCRLELDEEFRSRLERWVTA